MRTIRNDPSDTARMTEWLKRSGLNASETALADVHQKTATVLVDLLFGAASGLRAGLWALERGIFQRHRTA